MLFASRVATGIEARIRDSLKSSIDETQKHLSMRMQLATCTKNVTDALRYSWRSGKVKILGILERRAMREIHDDDKRH